MLRHAIHLLAITLVLLAGSGTTSDVAAASAPTCQRVQGSIQETLVTSGCTSIVGLCTVGQLVRNLKGEAHFTATAFIPSADTGATGVIFVIGDNLIVNAELNSKRGTLTTKSAAAFRITGAGDLVDLQTITGGTGDFAGATGSLHLSGNFVGTSGASTFEGTACVP